MAGDKESFLEKLLATFRVEADEHVAAMSAGLLSLEQAASGQRTAILEQVFREAHSLKGAARAVNLTDVETLCHSLESVLAQWKSGNVTPAPALFDLLHETLDALKQMSAAERPRDAAADAARLSRRLDSWSRGETPPAVATDAVAPRFRSVAQVPAEGGATVRIRMDRLSAIMRQTEELLGPRLAAAQRVVELREARAELQAWKKESAKLRSARSAVERALRRMGVGEIPHELAQVLDHVEAENVVLGGIDDRIDALHRACGSDSRVLSQMIERLLHEVKETYMLPFSTLLDGVRKLVRELVRDRNKEVELLTSGEEIEVDLRILEEVKAPLHHLIRNCVDHGIEDPDVRRRKGKPASGTIAIRVTHKDSRVEIAISDDGAGIDVSGIRAAAVRLGILSADQAARSSDKELVSLLFQSGVSTSARVTEISGRGLGLSIVQEKVERLGGVVDVQTGPGAGMEVRIDIPLALATFRGVLVEAAGEQFVIPAAGIERVGRVSPEDIHTVENRETISLGGRAVSLVRLSDVLERPRASADSVQPRTVVVLRLGSDPIALRVDAVIAEQEVLVKGLGSQLRRVRNVAGATVMGTGHVVPVLSVPDLMKSAVRVASRPEPAAVAPAAPAERRSILVVEDSITSRTLLEGILESAGYDVTVAVDGVDAYSKLKTQPFDLVVSDVEMPRMSGFELTAKIRGDPALSDLPVVLVTALALPEQRERGIDAGANAYIVKSNFDESDLLEAVRRLI